MVDEAKKHEEDDKARREEVEYRNRADQLCYQVEKTLDESKDRLPIDKVSTIKDLIVRLRSAIDKQDKDGIRSGTEALEKQMHELAQTAYQAAGSPSDKKPGSNPPSGSGGGSQKKSSDDVIDAEYEEGN